MNSIKKNYAKKMQEILLNTPKGTRLLLHSCCAPCSSACLEILHKHFDVTVLYYNPNIQEEREYEKRKAEQIALLQKTGWAKFLDCDHDSTAFQTATEGLENEPERGKRCYVCYALRLEKTAKIAAEHGFAYFGTTLTLSPLKNTDWLNEIGENAGGRYGVNYLFSDFKKGGGYQRSLQLSKEFGLYRQDFCGCSFSKLAREQQKKNKENAAKNQAQEDR
jgi:predicted adenine nucleotide alpha hydrolase (AANH) superfamily ATPase